MIRNLVVFAITKKELLFAKIVAIIAIKAILIGDINASIAKENLIRYLIFIYFKYIIIYEILIKGK